MKPSSTAFLLLRGPYLNPDLNSVYQQVLVVIGATAAVIFAIAFATAGCADDVKVATTDSGRIGFNDSDTGNNSDVDCGSIDVDACVTNTTCTTINGHTLYADGEDSTCVNWAEAPLPLGCMDADTGCDDAITFAAPADAADDITTCTLFTTTTGNHKPPTSRTSAPSGIMAIFFIASLIGLFECRAMRSTID